MKTEWIVLTEYSELYHVASISSLRYLTAASIYGERARQIEATPGSPYLTLNDASGDVGCWMGSERFRASSRRLICRSPDTRWRGLLFLCRTFRILRPLSLRWTQITLDALTSLTMNRYNAQGIPAATNSYHSAIASSAVIITLQTSQNEPSRLVFITATG
jgi:hypothetical protein